MKVDKKNERYSKRNSQSIYYNDNNDDNWMKDIAPLTACPQNREKNNHGIGGFIGNGGIFSPCMFSGIGNVESFNAMPPKKSTCGVAGLWCIQKKLQHWWFGSAFQWPSLMPCPQQNQPVGLLVFDTTSPKKQSTCSIISLALLF